MEIIELLSNDLGITQKQISNVLTLADEGNTIPFIARYRKELTGNLDEVAIKTILDRHKSLTSLSERKQVVLEKISEQGKLTPQLQEAILSAEKLAEVEDLYLPYKEKRRTKASLARENGLSGLTRLILQDDKDIIQKAQDFVTELFDTPEKALVGALDILIDVFSEDAKLRSWTYNEMLANSLLVTKVKDQELDDKARFSIYYAFSSPIKEMKGYRTLAINRGERLGILKVSFEHHLDKMIRFYQHRFKSRNALIDEAISKSLKSKILPALERRLRSELTEEAEQGAIALFSENLRQLLLVSPLKGKMVLGFDPAFRTGAKLAIVDQTGKLLATDVIYPVAPASQAKIAAAKSRLSELITQYGIEIIAIGNGTASRESEAFVAEAIKNHPKTSYVIVNESGASVYSASDLARHEFPDLSVEKRSAISIARRLQDPLAELVKIDAKAIGVGQYQHDVNQKMLAEHLDFVVDTVVNQVGVNVNTASPTLLSHVAGFTKTISENVVKYREEHGQINSRQELKKVPRLGEKAFEQAAGFLRIPDGDNILDNTGVHPEAYPAVYTLFKELEIDVLNDLAKKKLLAVDVVTMAEKLDLGQATLRDIIADLLKPGRDLRDDCEAPLLRQDVLSLSDLHLGQSLEGTVRNVVDFGVFVDVGVHEDGLIHISDLSETFIKHPSQVVTVGQVLKVWVKSVDLDNNKLNLTLVAPDGFDNLR